MVGGAVLGLVAGLFVWLLDKPKAEGQRIAEGADAPEGGQAPGVVTQSSGSVITRFFAVLTVLLCWAPVVGLILGGIAWFLNRNVHGWPKTVSRVGTIIALLITGLAILVVSLSPSR